MFKGLGTTAVLLLAATLAGCGDDAQSSSDAGGNGGEKRSNAPGPPTGGTLTDDMGKSSMSIPRIPPWEDYVEQYNVEHNGTAPRVVSSATWPTNRQPSEMSGHVGFAHTNWPKPPRSVAS